jgi:hypothetical protein
MSQSPHDTGDPTETYREPAPAPTPSEPYRPPPLVGVDAPRQGGFLSSGRLACFGCSVLSLALAIGAGGFGLYRTGALDEVLPEGILPTPVIAEGTPTAAGPDAADAGDEEVAEDAESAPAGTGPEGSRRNPLAEGSTVQSPIWDGTFEVTVQDVEWDASATVEDVNPMFNDDPGDGEKYVLVTFDAIYWGEEDTTENPGFSINVTFIDPGGEEYDESFAITPHTWTGEDDLADGESGVFDKAFLVPDDVDEGTLEISSILEASHDGTFVRIS